MKITGAPKKIWLQAGDDTNWGEGEWNHAFDEHVTWCDSPVQCDDVEYVRADLLNKPVVPLNPEWIRAEAGRYWSTRYEYRDFNEAKFAAAVVAEFCRINGIGA